MQWIFLVVLVFGHVSGKVYERCELARELRHVHEAADHQLATWVCIAEHESQYNTTAVGHLNGDGSGDHGLFQISDLFWCSPPGWACGVSCSQLEDDDLEDDFICARRIYREHKQLSGDGFNAWAVYRPHCAGGKADKYLEGCFEDHASRSSPSSPSTTTPKSSTRGAARQLHHNKVHKEMIPRFVINKWKGHK